jgi:hypothetical protein
VPPDDAWVNEPGDIDDALRLAVDRTREAQHHVSEELDREGIPDESSVETVVERADDLKSLADEAVREVRTGTDEDRLPS